MPNPASTNNCHDFGENLGFDKIGLVLFWSPSNTSTCDCSPYSPRPLQPRRDSMSTHAAVVANDIRMASISITIYECVLHILILVWLSERVLLSGIL